MGYDRSRQTAGVKTRKVSLRYGAIANLSDAFRHISPDPEVLFADFAGAPGQEPSN
jgi:hypothetical protein